MSNETKQTAVEWYGEKSIILFDNFQTSKINFKEWFKQLALLLGQAKEMEKSQHEKTYNQSFMSNFPTFEDYYNETYGGNK